MENFPFIEMNNAASSANTAYADTIRALFTSNADAKILSGHARIFDCLEKCFDLCEQVADVIEKIIIKNT